jgi:hypothetical protein
MATKYMTASAALGASGAHVKGSRIFITGDQAVGTVGTLELKTGGAAGSTVWKAYMDGGSCGQYRLPANLVFDYVTISNVEICIEYYKPHGIESSI